MANLHDLPTELILQIVHQIRRNILNLYSLGLTSKRLNNIVMPFFLSSCSIYPENGVVRLKLKLDDHSRSSSASSSSSTLEKKGRIDGLSGLRTAFYLESIDELQCIFKQTLWNANILESYLRRLIALLERLSTLKTLVLHFEGDHRYRDTYGSPKCQVTPSFASAFARLLASLPELGCINVSLFNQSFYLQDWEDSVTQAAHGQEDYSGATISPRTSKHPVAKRRGGVLDMVSRAKFRFDSAVSHIIGGSTSPPPPPPKDIYIHSSNMWHGQVESYPQSSLRSLCIQTPFALLNLCLPATRQLFHISSTSLTSLTLSHIELDPKLFDLCLSSFAMRNSLTSLTLRHCRRVIARSLLKFLAVCRTHLQILELDRSVGYLTPGENHQRLHFPSLHTLRAPGDWYAHFLLEDSWHLDEQENFVFSIPLPRLRSVFVHCRTQTTDCFTFEAFSPFLDSIFQILQPRHQACRYSDGEGLNIALDVAFNLDEPWQLDCDRAVFNMLSNAPRRRNPNITGAASDTYPVPRFAVSQAQLLSNLTTCKCPERWDIVTQLRLSNRAPPTERFEASLLTRWVNTFFPAVREVTLGRPVVSDASYSSPSRRNRTAETAAVQRAVKLLETALRETSFDPSFPPEIAWTTVIIGDVEYTLDVTNHLPPILGMEVESGGGFRVGSYS